MIFHALEPRPDALVIFRDIDTKKGRLQGFEAALESYRDKEEDRIPVILAAPNPEAEAWLIASFEPEDKADQERLQNVSKDLGFDPRLKPENLTSKHRIDPKDAKRVLEELIPDEEERKRCLETDLATLRARGKKCGLKDFIGQARAKLVPIFTNRS